VLELSIADVVTVKVIGVLDTILPDGSPGYSLLFIITFDLPPIQLGFGFTLNGVGGLGGVNRTMVISALQAGPCAFARSRIVPARSRGERAADHQRHRELLPAAAGPLRVRSYVVDRLGHTDTARHPGRSHPGGS
jgi:hypothetical protein